MHIVKTILAICMSGIYIHCSAQKVDTNTIASPLSDNIYIESNYANIEIITWDKAEIEMTSSVLIFGQADHNQSLITTVDNTTSGISINANLNTENIKQKMIITEYDGSKIYLDLEDGQDINTNSNHKSINIGYEVDITLIIKIPIKMILEVSALYGDISVMGQYADVAVHSTYGMIEGRLQQVNNTNTIRMMSTYDLVDLAVKHDPAHDINISTSYGEVYSDIPLKSNQSTSHHCGAKKSYYQIGEGVNIELISTYDNVYLRSNPSL